MQLALSGPPPDTATLWEDDIHVGVSEIVAARLELKRIRRCRRPARVRPADHARSSPVLCKESHSRLPASREPFDEPICLILVVAGARGEEPRNSILYAHNPFSCESIYSENRLLSAATRPAQKGKKG
jgi:hypothetical protein